MPHTINLYRCCSKSKVVDIEINYDNVGFRGSKSSKYNLSREKIQCGDERENALAGMEECNDGSYREFILGSKLYTFSRKGSKLIITNNCDQGAPEVIIDQSVDNFCVSNIQATQKSISTLKFYLQCGVSARVARPVFDICRSD